MKIDSGAAVADASEYYDERHARGWMDFWPEDKKQRVISLIRNAGIGERGRVLEYGCGVGVFAEALKQAIPSLDVHGCDISEVGVQKAGARCPDVRFHKIDSAELGRLEGTFDLVYSHHVLEHVHDVADVMRKIHALLRPGGKALHIVPCGNAGSLEYKITALTTGVDSAGRFSTEDSSHVRRLTSPELTATCREYGFQPRQAVFANQFWGGVDYLTGEYHWTLLRWLNPRGGKNGAARLQLLLMAIILVGVSLLRRGPAYVLQMLRKPVGAAKKLLFLAALPLAILLYPVSFLCDRMIWRLKEREWRLDRNSENGSEMYCLFEKSIRYA
jgi:2-polyprenyl-3-methyl-5-hydroxy-6-metoxy-1,4-benzoquinol methylase